MHSTPFTDAMCASICTNCKRIRPDHSRFYLHMKMWMVLCQLCHCYGHIFGMLEWASAHALRIRFHVFARVAVVGKTSLASSNHRSQPQRYRISFRMPSQLQLQISFLLGKCRICCRRTYLRMRTVHGFAHRNWRETKKKGRNCRNLSSANA